MTDYTGPQMTADQMKNAVRDVIGGTLRQLYALLGDGDELPPEPGGDRHHLLSMSSAWERGYTDALADADVDGESANPYEELLDDRREFVREQVNNAYGAAIDEDGVDVLGDDNTEWFDAVLDAHDEWLALQQRKATS